MRGGHSFRLSAKCSISLESESKRWVRQSISSRSWEPEIGFGRRPMSLQGCTKFAELGVSWESRSSNPQKTRARAQFPPTCLILHSVDEGWRVTTIRPYRALRARRVGLTALLFRSTDNPVRSHHRVVATDFLRDREGPTTRRVTALSFDDRPRGARGDVTTHAPEQVNTRRTSFNHVRAVLFGLRSAALVGIHVLSLMRGADRHLRDPHQ